MPTGPTCIESSIARTYTEPMPVRRNALHRAGEDMARELADYGFTLDADARTLTTPMGVYTFRERMTRTECRAFMRRYTRMVDMSRKITHDIQAERMQDPLL